MKMAEHAARIIRRNVRLRDIPASWKVELPGEPDTPVTVVITPGSAAGGRPLSSFIGAGRGVFGSPKEVDSHLRQQRDAWEE